MGHLLADDGVGRVCNSPALVLGQNSLALSQGVGSTCFAPALCMRCAKGIKASLLICYSDREVLSTMLHARHLKIRHSGHYSITTALSLQQLMQTQSCTLLVKCAMLGLVKTKDSSVKLVKLA